MGDSSSLARRSGQRRAERGSPFGERQFPEVGQRSEEERTVGSKRLPLMFVEGQEGTEEGAIRVLD